jgi:putative flippase GtrA
LRERIMRARKELPEIGKFGVIGVIAWVVDTGVFNVMLSMQGNRYWAAVVSTSVSATVAFIGNRFWTWRDRPRSGLRREYILYAIFNVVGLAISLACLGLSHEVLGSMWPSVFHTRLADNVAKQGVGLLLGTMFRFWSYRRFIFREAPKRSRAVPDGTVPATPAPGTAPARHSWPVAHSAGATGPGRAQAAADHNTRPPQHHGAGPRPARTQRPSGSPVADHAAARFDD